MQLRQDSSVHVGEFLLVPSPDEGGGDQGEDTLKMDRSNEKKKMKISEKKRKKNDKKKEKRNIKEKERKNKANKQKRKQK